MKKYIVTVYNSKENKLTTVEISRNSLSEVEEEINSIFNGWAQITAIIVTI